MPNKKQAAGFTLIEIVVAVAILAIVIVPLAGKTSWFLSTSISLEEETLAFWIAENKFAELSLEARLEEWPEPGRSEDTVMMSEREWDIATEIAETSSENLHRVEIKVALHKEGVDITDDINPLVELVGFIGQY